MNSTHDFLNDDNTGKGEPRLKQDADPGTGRSHLNQDTDPGTGRSRRKQETGHGKRNACIAVLFIAATAVLAAFLLFKYSGSIAFDRAGDALEKDNGSHDDIDSFHGNAGGYDNADITNAGIAGNDSAASANPADIHAEGSGASGGSGAGAASSDNAHSALTGQGSGQASDIGEAQAETGKYTDLLSDKDRMAEENCYPVDDGGDGIITIRFAGDLLLDDSYAISAGIRQRSGGALSAEAAFDEGLLKLMREADIFMINNEFTFTSRGTPTANKKFTFRARPENVGFLNDIGADIVTLANNHAYDYGEVSLLDSMETLKGAGIIYAGAGHDIAEASSPVYYVSDNLKIAIIASTQIERTPSPDTKGATADSPGVFRSLDPSALTEAIRKAKENSDLVIVYTHWGTESQSATDWFQNEQAPVIAEAGADLIIGSHPHILQKIEWQGGTPIFYSLGNYLFNSKTLDTGLAEVNIDASDGSIISLRFIPAVQSGCRTFLPSGEDYGAALLRMRELSPNVVIDDEGYIFRAGAGS